MSQKVKAVETMSESKSTNVSEKYIDLISKSEEQISSEQLELEVQKAKSTIEITIATTKLDLANARQQLARAKSKVPYSLQDEMEASQEVNSLEEGLFFAINILELRF